MEKEKTLSHVLAQSRVSFDENNEVILTNASLVVSKDMDVKGLEEDGVPQTKEAYELLTRTFLHGIVSNMIRARRKKLIDYEEHAKLVIETLREMVALNDVKPDSGTNS